MFVHDRLAEGVLKHKFRLEELERAEEKAKHVRAVRGRFVGVRGVRRGYGSSVRHFPDRGAF